MLSHGGRVGFEAWIETKHDGKRLPTHELEQHDPGNKRDEGRSEAYAECVEGTEFAVCVSKLAACVTPRDWDFELFIDGKSAESTPLSAGKTSTIAIGSIKERENARILKNPLRFIPVSTTDDINEVDVSLRNQKALGTIAITIRNGNIGRSGYLPSQKAAVEAHPEVTVEEKKFKLGTSVCTSGTGEDWAEVDENVRYYTFTKKSRTTVFYRFVWKYRTREKLIALKVISPPKVVSEDRPPKRARVATPPTVATEDLKDFLVDEKPGFSIISAQQKRIMYLEAQNAKLNGIVKRGTLAERDVIDVSEDTAYQ